MVSAASAQAPVAVGVNARNSPDLGRSATEQGPNSRYEECKESNQRHSTEWLADSVAELHIRTMSGT